MSMPKTRLRRCAQVTDPRQTVPQVPAVGLHPVVGQVAVEVVREVHARPVGQTVRRVVRGASQGWRQRHPREIARHRQPTPRGVVRVAQRAQGRGQFVAVVVSVIDRHQIGQCRLRPSARHVVLEAHRVGALGDRGQPVRVVVAIGHRRLPGHLHLRAPRRHVVAAGDGARSHLHGDDFGCDCIETVVVGAGHRFALLIEITRRETNTKEKNAR